jgi:acyl dehydratase
MNDNTRGVPDVLSTAVLWEKGSKFEDFAVGQVFIHHWGRSVTKPDNIQFATLTLHYNPLYFNTEFAKAHGHPQLVVVPMLVFNTVLGLSVEALSEGGGAFLGADQLRFHRHVYVGDTLTARSTVVDIRESKSQPDRGIVTWHTEGLNQDGELVVDYRRANFKLKRGH